MPRKGTKKDAAIILSGLDKQPGKMVVDIFIDLNDCQIQKLNQITYKVKPNPKIESGLKIGEIPPWLIREPMSLPLYC